MPPASMRAAVMSPCPSMGGHDPLVVGADKLPGRRDQRAVVAAGGDQFADPRADAVAGVGSRRTIKLISQILPRS